MCGVKPFSSLCSRVAILILKSSLPVPVLPTCLLTGRRQTGFECTEKNPEWNKLIRVDYHGSKEVPTGTCHAILKASGIKK